MRKSKGDIPSNALIAAEATQSHFGRIPAGPSIVNLAGEGDVTMRRENRQSESCERLQSFTTLVNHDQATSLIRRLGRNDS
jgi:hypothetical protein